MEPEPHMALAKYFLAHNERLEAFLTLEAARRGRFAEPVFNQAFMLHIREFDNSKKAEDALLAEHVRQPESVDVLYQLADIYISREQWARAKPLLLEAVKKKPDGYTLLVCLIGVLQAEGNKQEADRLGQDYISRHPESEPAYLTRAEQAREKEPAKAKEILRDASVRFPNSGSVFFDLAIVLQKESDLQPAEAAFVRAAELSPDSADIQAWTGRFFYKARHEDSRALQYYLNAYFLDPHAYETEYVESRIRKIAFDAGAKSMEEQLGKQVALIDLLDSADPTVVILALEKMAESWQSSCTDKLVGLMGHQDQGIRWMATELLKGHVDRSFDERLKGLLHDRDLRRRGLAAYIAVHLWRDQSFQSLSELLRDPAQLVRFDAISALMMEGGPAGRQIVFAHAARETSPEIRKLIAAEKAAPSPQTTP